MKVKSKVSSGVVLKSFDVQRIRSEFPALNEFVDGRPLVYLDNAATTQKPKYVLESEMHFYLHDCANIHRAVHAMSERATEAYEESRIKAQKFIKARSHLEIIFVRGTTEAINLVASSYGRSHVVAGDEILISAIEHHSNIVPWQMLCEEKGAHLKVIPMDDRGELDLEAYVRLFSKKTKLVSIAHVSNALGTVNPIKRMIEIAHDHQVPVLVDGAQAIPHVPVNVSELNCDFYAFSSHKMFGPTGAGVLYGKEELLERMPPYQGGGDMISSVTFEKTTYNSLPYKFEAGTPNIAGAIGMGAAIDYLETIDFHRVEEYEAALLDYATKTVGAVEGVRLIGTAPDKVGVLSFLLGDIHPHDVGTLVDQDGIAIRTGHHCAQPVMDRLKIAATCRASFAFYNTREEIDLLAQSLERVKEVFHT